MTEHPLWRRLVGYYPGPYPNPGVLPYVDRYSAASVRDAWREFLATSRFADEIGLYVHVPYCVRLCSFCDCSRDEWTQQVNLERYLDRLFVEMDYFRETFAGTTFNRLYIGGGTPNILEPDQLARLAGGLRERFRIAPEVVRCIEFAPELTTPEKLDTVRTNGFTRVSFGVQSMNDAVLRAVNRPGMSAEKARAAVGAARAAGVPEVNVDLIYGLADEDDASFLRGLDGVLSVAPTSVTLQLLNSSPQARVYASAEAEQRTLAGFLDFAASLERWLARAFPSYQLEMRPRTLVLRARSMARPWRQFLDFYSSQDRVVVSTLGFGSYAHSRMHGGLRCQNNIVTGPFEPTRLQYDGCRHSVEVDAVMDVVCDLMNEGECHLDVVTARYGALPPALVEEIEAQAQTGALRRNARRIVHGETEENPLKPLLARLVDGLPASAAGGQPARVSLAVQRGAGTYVVHIERANPDRPYYANVEGVGVYYAVIAPSADASIGEVMEAVVRSLRDGPAGFEPSRAEALARAAIAGCAGWIPVDATMLTPAAGSRQTAGPRRVRVRR